MSAEPIVCDLAPFNAVLRVSGDDAEAFLQGQTTNDVKALASGAAQWNGWCTPKGRLLVTFALARDATGFLMLLPAAFAEATAKRLRMFVLRSKVTVTDVSADLPPYGLWGGPLPAGAFAIGEGRGLVFGERPAGRQASLDEWSLSLIREGVVQVVPGTQEEFVPQMANWDLIGAVNFKKGCYPGQEIVARTQYRGILKKRTARVAADQAMAPGNPVYCAAFGDQAAGMVANSAPSPEGGWEALVVAQIEAITQRDLRLGDPAGPALRFL